METNRGYDVIAIGGGPGGALAAAMLKRYDPSLNVLVLEKERFPRDHIGESLLPGVCHVLNEVGVWDKVEAADFPVKLGASLTWGRNADSWEFDFYPVEDYRDEPRPGKFAGQRAATAFQVDRSIFDSILLDHAQSLGAEVRQEVQVEKVLREPDSDRIDGLVLSTGETVRARYYLDCSGRSGVLRRAMGVESWVPGELKNIAIYDYWQNAEWAVKIGVGGTRIQVRSLPWGWFWFIPLGPTRTSMGLVCPAEYYKKCGKRPEELYREAIELQPEIQKLIANATSEGKLTATNDWSHLSSRIAGENWFLVGEAAGFADPILSAGVNLTASSARDAAYSILELDRGVLNPAWLRARYDTRHRTAIDQHIRFAQYWYASNGCFTELQEHCRNIAKEGGLNLSPMEAWSWLAQGGFAHEQPGHAVLGSFEFNAAKRILANFDKEGRGVPAAIENNNVFELNLDESRPESVGFLDRGRIRLLDGFRRGERVLAVVGPNELVYFALSRSKDIVTIVQHIRERLQQTKLSYPQQELALHKAMAALESLVAEGWVTASMDRTKARVVNKGVSATIRSSQEGAAALKKRDEKARAENVMSATMASSSSSMML
ncbi:MAG: tryptophan 7-halogenase [Phycisphaerales bacterium]|nr:tryptophan 7-halogenase [Phycisphaerales bacterium]